MVSGGLRAISSVIGGAVTTEMDTMDAYDYGTDTVGVGNCLDSVDRAFEHELNRIDTVAA